MRRAIQLFEFFGRFLVTIRHLTARQIFFQIKLRVIKRRRSSLSTAKFTRSKHLQVREFEDSLFMGHSKPSTVDGFNFNFLNKSGFVIRDYDDPTQTKLWIYNLHYQNDLAIRDWASTTDQRKNLILNWIRYNQNLSGVGWDPYCISLRLVNWVKWISYNRKKSIDRIILFSIRDQARCLRDNVEYHLGANHLIANAKGLIFAGALFHDSDAEQWLFKGIDLLNKELAEQFLSDGAHYELSPMYHSIILWDLLDLIALAQSTKLKVLLAHSKKWTKKFECGLGWLKNMLHPDGDIPFFNDATFGIAPRYSDLTAYAVSMGLKTEHGCVVKDKLQATIIRPSGFGLIDWPDGSKVIANFAHIGPAYQPGHSHADTLSFELSVLGERIIVNSGISEYAVGPTRLKQRSTAAHNTVEINGQNSSDVWSSFRVGRRATPFLQYEHNTSDVSFLRCAHDGYSKPFRTLHHVRLFEARSHSLSVTDEVLGSFELAKACFYLVPNTKIISLKRHGLILKTPGGRRIMVSTSGGCLEIRAAEWFPAFGDVIQNLCIELEFKAPKINLLFDWSN